MLELATGHDREVVNALAAQVHAMHAGWRPDIYEAVEELYPQERFLTAIQNRQLYVAKISGIVVGYTAVKIHNFDWPGVVKRKIMFIDEFGVEESCRGQGIGREMMADLHALAKAFGCTDFQLNVNAHNDDAITFYQKCGFMIQNIVMQRKV